MVVVVVVVVAAAEIVVVVVVVGLVVVVIVVLVVVVVVRGGADITNASIYNYTRSSVSLRSVPEVSTELQWNMPGTQLYVLCQQSSAQALNFITCAHFQFEAERNGCGPREVSGR